MRKIPILLLLIGSIIGCVDNVVQKKSNLASRGPQKDSATQLFPNCLNASKQSFCKVSSISGSKANLSYLSNNLMNRKYMQPISKITEPPRNPFLPFFIGYHGNSIHSCTHINGLTILVQTVGRIGKQLSEPDEIIKQNTLTDFNILVRLIRTMNAMQLENATLQLYTKLDSKVDYIRFLTWGVYRDAVVQAGTGPAMVTLLKWIQNDLIEGEEAAQLISTVTNTAEYPTEEFMKLFFEIVEISDVMNKIYVNSSAVLAFGSLIKKVYVCHKSMHLRFPVYSFGRSVSKHSRALDLIYFPYLINKLKQAVLSGDTHKIQVYIRSIGNTAHPRILDAFKPYLNGQDKISKFQRLLMVISLDSITIVHPKLTRSALYDIYRNLGESPEIRTAAVTLIMRTNPPAEMLQRMAEATNWDSSEQVNAAVKTAIEAATELDNELGNNARKVVNYLTTKSYGFQYSSNYIRSHMDENENLGYSLTWNHIQSKGSIFPSSFFYTLRPNLGGFIQRAYKYSWMWTSTDDLMKLLSDQILSKSLHYNNTYSGNAWTPASITKMLGIQPEENDQVEGNFYFTLHGARRFFTFDNHTLHEFPKLVKFASSAFKIGDTFNYTKIYNQYSLRFAFPTATGLPFVYTVEAPTIVSIVGEARLNSHPDLANGSLEKILLPTSLNLTSDFKAQFSTKTEAKLGFITPFNHQHYLVGCDSNIHLNLPLRVKVDVDFDNQKFWSKIQPLYPNKYQKIVELSSMAYSTIHNILDITPPQMDEFSHIIHTRPTKKFSTTSGHHMTGFAFDITAKTEQTQLNLANIIDIFSKPDIISAIMFFDKRKFIQSFNNFTICFNPLKTTAKFAKFIVNYGDVVEYAANEEHESLQSNQAIPTFGLGEHKKRVEQLLKRSTVGMRDSYAEAIGISLEFEGESNGVFTMAGAYARSYVSKRARYLFFFAKEPAVKSQSMKPLQLAVDAHIMIPNVPLDNFEEAVRSEPTSAIIARLNLGEKASTGAEVVIKGQLEKSASRINYLHSLPLAKLCEKQMNESNYLLQACHNVTIRSNFLDHYYLRVDYQNVADAWKKTAYNMYTLVRHSAYPYTSENVINQTNINGRIELDILFSNDMSSLDAKLAAPTFSCDFINVDVNKYFQPAVVFHPQFSVLDRMYERIILSGIKPRCVVDDTYAVTFDNVTYPVFTGRCWHTLLQFAPLDNSGNEESRNNLRDITLLTREVEWRQRELAIVLGEGVIKFQATSGSPNDYFTVNEERFDVTQEIMGHFEDKSGKTLIRAYKLPTGTVKIFIPFHDIILLYDGLRIEVQASNQYRGKIRGLCGTFDGETSNDFTIPKNCILRNPLEFAASYSIADGSCLGPAKELRHTAQNAPCYKQPF